MGEQQVTATTVVDSIERYHRRRRRDKTLDPTPVPCSSPRCRTGWEALAGGPYCLECDTRIRDRADALRAKVSA